jgi:signal transduction histidine kinase/DNA-binding response OmpR family regulator
MPGLITYTTRSVLVSVLTFSVLFFTQAGFATDLQKAQSFFKNSRYDSAYTYSKRSFEEFQGHGDSIEFRSAMIAGISVAQQKIRDSTDYIGIAHQIAVDSKNPQWLAEADFARGKELFLKSLYGDALPYFLKVDSLARKHSFKNETTVDAVFHRSEISRLAFTSQAVNTAYDLMLEALEMAQEIQADHLEHVIYLQLSDLNGLRENYDEAKRYADIAFGYFAKIDDVRKVSRIYWIYASYYQVTDQIGRCEETHRERIDYLREKDLPVELASALVAYGNFCRKTKEACAEALGYFEEAKSIYEEINDSPSDRYLRLVVGMAICNAEIGNYHEAYDYYDLAYGLKVEAMQRANQELTRDLETKYQTSKKEREIELLSAQNKIAEQQKVYQRNLFIAAVIIFVVLLTFITYGYKNKLKTAKRLRELDELKSRFFANISHEFRTPLTLIKSPLQSVLEEETVPDKIKKLHLIDRNADRMLNLVDQLLELSRLDAGSLKLILKKGNLSHFLHALAETFAYEAKQRNLDFSTTFNIHEDETWFDNDALEKIFGNLLSNAIKYTPTNEKISFEAKTERNFLFVKVRNTGVSLSKAEMNKIFERFYQKDENNPGAGIGLALAKELITLYNGEISIGNEANTLTFSVTIPLDREQLKGAVVVREDEPAEVIKIYNATENGDLPVLLIAEDNASLRQIIRDLFTPDFQILEAVDGNEAFKIAKRKVPDIIISDVMMPHMNGFEFSRAIKENEVTSFIPVVLLTARTGDEAHLESLKNQADAYLTKPFNNNILRSKVSQLLRERAKLRERYSQELVLRPKDIVLNSADMKFLERLQHILDHKLENPKFSAEDFAMEVGMSRMQLHRKLKSLTGLSATEFMRSERLKMALPMLKNDQLNVSEVAYAVGFNDVSYFSKCFKDQYGATPSEYGKAR